MNTSRSAVKFLGVALVALALIALPALAVTSQYSGNSSPELRQSSHGGAIPFREPGTGGLMGWALGLAFVAGTVTVTYKYPVSGTTPPTAIEASQVPTVTGIVTFAESDTTGLFTHNFGLATGAGAAGLQPSLASFFPEVIITSILNSGTVVANIQIDYASSTGNQLVFAKGSIAGTGGTLLFTVRKPHSIGL